MKGERSGRRRFWWVGAALLAVGAAILAHRLLDTENEVTAAAPATTALDARAKPDASPVPPSATSVEPAASAALQAAASEIEASIDLRAAVSSENCSTAQGRAASLAMLSAAETSAERLHQLVVQSVGLLRESAPDAKLDARRHDELRLDVAAATGRTLMLADRLRDIRLQAISTARSLIAFMEENAGGFEVRDGFVSFARQGAQDQFNHFQVNTSRVLAQELQARNETADALVEQQALLARAQAN